MAIHELRRFTFFDLNTDCDNGAIKALLGKSQLKLATSGHGSFILCENEGIVHILNRNFKGTSFRAYAVNTTLAEYIKYSPFLVTVGEDEMGINPLLKVWNTEKLDRNGNPICLRVTRLCSALSKLSSGQKPVQPTCLCVHENANLLAVGFQDGCILLFRGDVTRDKSSKPKLLKEARLGTITGLAFRNHFLFATSVEQVFYFDVSVKDKEVKVELDKKGCQLNCSLMAESPHGANFVVARDDAIYCYTTDGKGSCYAVDGEKNLIQWSKTYLVIVSKEETKPTAFQAASRLAGDGNVADNEEITILDMQNKLIVFSAVLKSVLAVLVEWGSFYIITKDHKIHHLAEKNVQTKLALLFKKNRYDIAIRMAKSQHYDEEGLVDIFRQYGDHLYAKGDRFGAIEQYIKTIGKLEPSYIIRRFMESAHMEQLMGYLQALHRAGFADEDHTTLLLNCYTKLGRTNDLKNFIMTKDKELDFDIDIALRVVRSVSPEDALQLAKAHGKHLWVVRILLEDQKKYQEALQHIKTLDVQDTDKCFLEFGDILINSAPKETTEFLKLFCTESRPQTKSQDPFEPAPPSRPKPQDYLHLFLNKSEYLVEFLEYLTQNQTGWGTQIYNALVEHYLVVWSKADDEHRGALEQRIMKLLQNPDAMYDRDQTFILCRMYNFSPGVILLYEENKMYHQVLHYHLNQEDYKAVLGTCKRYGFQDPSLWIQALWSIARQTNAPPNLLSDILAVIEKEKLLSPLLTIEALGDAPATLGQVRKYLMTVLQAEEELLAKESELIQKYTAETDKVKTHIKDLQTNATIFQGSRCSICQHQLELPSIHFFCQHSYHQHCFQGYSENENECIVCKRNNKQLLDMIKYQEQNHELHETFHSQLEKADDGFSIVADYFGRGVFNTLPAVPPDVGDALPPPPPTTQIKPEFKPATEPRRETPIKPEGRLHEPPKSTALERIEANLKHVEERQDTSHRAVGEISSSLSPACNNPFEEYDETKNPFADEEEDESSSTNPFAGNNEYFEYDEHKNPFA